MSEQEERRKRLRERVEHWRANSPGVPTTVSTAVDRLTDFVLGEIDAAVEQADERAILIVRAERCGPTDQAHIDACPRCWSAICAEKAIRSRRESPGAEEPVPPEPSRDLGTCGTPHHGPEPHSPIRSCIDFRWNEPAEETQERCGCRVDCGCGQADHVDPEPQGDLVGAIIRAQAAKIKRVEAERDVAEERVRTLEAELAECKQAAENDHYEYLNQMELMEDCDE